MIIKKYYSLGNYSAGYDPQDTITDIIEWSYEKKFCGVGQFELVLPAEYSGISFNLNEFLVADGEAFIIKRVQIDEEHITVSGYDLNGILLDRITVAMSEDGKDRVSGSTETIVKHFVEANCVSSEDTNRNFPGLMIAEDMERGIADDAASPRFECVADVITDILSAQKMGWRISPVITGKYSESMVFEVYKATNSTVGFSYNHANVQSIKSSRSNIDMKNTLYCELDNGTVQTYSKWSNSGFERVEEYTDLGCELSELSVYASHELAERYKSESSNTLENIDPFGYLSNPKQFDVGWKAEVYDERLNMSYSPQIITAIKIKRSGGETELSVTLGETRTKPLDRIERKSAAAVTACKGMSPAVKDGIASGSIGSGLGIVVSGGYDWVGTVGGNGIRVEDHLSGYYTFYETPDGEIGTLKQMAPGVMISVQDKNDKAHSYGVIELGNNVFTIESSSKTRNFTPDYDAILGGPEIMARSYLFSVGITIKNNGICDIDMGTGRQLRLKFDKTNQALHLKGIKRLYIEDTKVFDIENEG